MRLSRKQHEKDIRKDYSVISEKDGVMYRYTVKACSFAFARIIFKRHFPEYEIKNVILKQNHGKEQHSSKPS